MRFCGSQATCGRSQTCSAFSLNLALIFTYAEVVQGWKPALSVSVPCVLIPRRSSTAQLQDRMMYIPADKSVGRWALRDQQAPAEVARLVSHKRMSWTMSSGSPGPHFNLPRQHTY